MIRSAALCLFLLAGCSGDAAPVETSAAERCFPAGLMLGLMKQNGMKPKWRGVDHEGDLLIVFTKPDGKWTMGILTASGAYCPLFRGDDWIGEKPEGRGA